MSISNYTELQAAVKNWLHRTDLDTRIPEFITLGESFLNREIKTPAMVETATVNTSMATRFAAFPAGCKKIISVIDQYGTPLRQRSDIDVAALSIGASTSAPQVYALTDQIEFDCVSDQVYAMTVQYYKKLDIANDTTNWLLTDYPDAYLYASLYVAMPFIKDDERAGYIKALRDEVVYQVNTSNKNRIPLRVDAALTASGTFDINRGE